jgi:hypothetical protein
MTTAPHLEQYEISKDGCLVDAIEATSKPEALALYAALIGIDPRVKRDGGGLQYVGDACTGRYYGREIADPAVVADWRGRYTHRQPFGMPVVLAEAIQAVGGLR